MLTVSHAEIALQTEETFTAKEIDATDPAILDMVNSVTSTDPKNPLAYSVNSIRKTYGRLGKCDRPLSSLNETKLENEVAEVDHPEQVQAVSRKAFVNQLIGVAICAAILDLAVKSNVGPSKDYEALPKMFPQQDAKRTDKIPSVDHNAASINILPAALMIAQMIGGTFTAAFTVLQVSIPFVVQNVLFPAATKFAQISTDVILPTAEQLASSASSVVLPAVDIDLRSVVSSPELPEGVRSVISDALPNFLPGAAQAGAAASAAIEAAGDTLRLPVTQVPFPVALNSTEEGRIDIHFRHSYLHF